MTMALRSVQRTLYVARLSDTATLPTRGSPFAAGLDLYASSETVVPARGKALVKTGLALKCPHGSYARIAPRSGLAWKSHIDVGAGVVDCDYRGEVGVVLFNHGENDLPVKVGDRVAQLILEQILMLPIEEVDSLDDTERGACGFGSTGVSKEETAASGEAAAVKRARTDEGEDSEIDKLKGSLLVAINKSNQEEAVKKKLKLLILSSDSRVNPIAYAFQESRSEESAVEDLKLLLSE